MYIFYFNLCSKVMFTILIISILSVIGFSFVKNEDLRCLGLFISFLVVLFSFTLGFCCLEKYDKNELCYKINECNKNIELYNYGIEKYEDLICNDTDDIEKHSHLYLISLSKKYLDDEIKELDKYSKLYEKVCEKEQKSSKK